MFYRFQISSRSMLVTGASYWWTISRISRTMEAAIFSAFARISCRVPVIPGYAVARCLGR